MRQSDGNFESIELPQFGGIPKYFWFFLIFLYLGGLGAAVWSGASDHVVLWDEFAKVQGLLWVPFYLAALVGYIGPTDSWGTSSGPFLSVFGCR